MKMYNNKENKCFVTRAMMASKSGGMFGLLNLLLVVAFVQHVTGLAQQQQQQDDKVEHVHFERAINGGMNNNIKFNDDIRKHTLTSTTPMARLYKFNDKEIDLDAYVNEFDMQEEAAIPEDILDQKHIDDNDDDELDETGDLSSDLTLESSSLNREMVENERQQKNAKNLAFEKPQGNFVQNIRSIGPMTFKARSNSNLNKQSKKMQEDTRSNNNNGVDNKKSIKDDNNNYMNLYNKNNESEIKGMQLEKSAIGDIENVARNEDEPKNQEEENEQEELRKSVIDRDKSVNNIRSGQAHEGMQTYNTWNLGTQLQMAANVNRSKKQRRNLPEMKFGHRRDNLDLYDDDDDDGLSKTGSDEYTIKTAIAVSSPAIAGTPEEINDYKKYYLDILSIRSNTSTPNVRLPLGQVQNKVLNGTSTDLASIEDSNKATDEANPTSIVSSKAFEQYKSKQRNKGRTGHKTHKKKYKDYLRYTWATLQTTSTETVTQRAAIINNNNIDKINATKNTSRQHKRAQKLQTEKSRGFQVPPIFMITSNQQGNMAVLKSINSTTARPFYEGQINYFLETKDENEEENVEQPAYVNDSKTSVGGSDTAWYRRASPMLRNGLRRTESNNINHMRQQHYPHKFHEHQTANRYHHKHQHHLPHALHQRHHHHHHQHHHQQQQQQKAAQVLGHQITDVQDFERYYAKWPHLARVQFQVYDEHLREAKSQQKTAEEDEYPEYEYGSVAEMEEAQKVKPEEENLPPYVRKYNRRNKQLLDLLEGPLPPPKGYHWSGSKLQPGPSESSDNAQVIRLDDDYMREKRRRHQLLHGNNNIHLNNNFFAQQRKNETAAKNFTELSMNNNHLPDELANVSEQQTSQAEMESESKTHVNKLIGNEQQMGWQIEKLLMPTTTSTIQTPKALVFRLPSFNSNQVGHAMLRQRSRSAHTAGAPGQRRHMSGLLDSMELHGFADDTESFSNNHNNGGRLEQQTTTKLPYPSTSYSYTPAPKPTAKIPTMPPRSISAFVYHRVVDNSPRQVGAGGALQGRKQQLPFVAITDRRLETFKKSLLERQKEFEQNNFPPLP